MSPHHSDNMSQGSQVSQSALWRTSRGRTPIERGASESGNVLTQQARVEQILCIIQSEG